MQPSFQFEELSEGLSICVSDSHKFGTDAFLLSDFARPKPKDTACDLGTGCGIVPLLWFRQKPPTRVYAVDIQPLAVEQVENSVEKNQLQGRLFPLCADLRALGNHIPVGSLDLVTCNPPYQAAGSGILSESASDQIARHETMCSIADVCATAARLLRFGGRLCICQRPERLTDTLDAMRRFQLEPKRLRFVQQRPDRAPWLFLVEGKRGAKPSIRVEAPLLIAGNGRDGFSEELLAIYGGGKI